MTDEKITAMTKAMIPMLFVMGVALAFIAHLGLGYEDSPLPMWFIAVCLWLSGANITFAIANYGDYYK